MATTAQMIERIRSVDFDALRRQAVEATAPEYIQATREQLYAGLRSDGGEISPPYAASTVQRKKRKGQPYDRVTLKDTGDFFAEMRLDIVGDMVEEDSNVPYAQYLEKNYTPAIWGLDDHNHEHYVQDEIAPFMRQAYSEITGITHK